MTNLFYTLVTIFTELITGLDGDHLKLWDLYEYVTVQEDVALIMNVISLVLVIFSILWLIAFIGDLFIDNNT